MDARTLGRQRLSTAGTHRLPLSVRSLVFVQCIVGHTTTAHAQMTTEPAVIDVAVFYSIRAREIARGAARIEAEIDLMVAETNQAYADGDVNLRVSLAAVAEVGEADHTVTIDELQDPSDGVVDEVHHIRDQVAEDVVVLINKRDTGDAVDVSSVTGNPDDTGSAIVGLYGGGFFFAHELGHVMGLRHDRYRHYEHDSRTSMPMSPWAFGYVNRRAFEAGAPASARWHTIMAYDDECAQAGFRCPPLLRFSNPNQVHPDPGGDPMGTSGEDHTTDVDGPADAVRTQNQTGPIVAEYRQAPAITVSFDAETYTATEAGSAATVTLRLSGEPTRPIDISLTATGSTGASRFDYDVPATVRFAATDRVRTFSVEAIDDGADDDGETVVLGVADPLPAGVTIGPTFPTTTVTLADNDDTATGAPDIVRLALTSETETAYGLGEQIEVTVWFARRVTVTGIPQIGVSVGTNTRQAEYQPSVGSGLHGWRDPPRQGVPPPSHREPSRHVLAASIRVVPGRARISLSRGCQAADPSRRLPGASGPSTICRVVWPARDCADDGDSPRRVCLPTTSPKRHQHGRALYTAEMPHHQCVTTTLCLAVRIRMALQPGCATSLPDFRASNGADTAPFRAIRPRRAGNDGGRLIV